MNITVSEAKSHFAELLKRAEAGEHIIVTRHGKPIARIEGIEKPKSLPRIGALIVINGGQIEMADDFDKPLEAFAEYRK